MMGGPQAPDTARVPDEVMPGGQCCSIEKAVLHPAPRVHCQTQKKGPLPQSSTNPTATPH